MAEGWAKHHLKHIAQAYSAGTVPHGLNPYAVQVMQEAGIDITSHESKHIDSLKGISFNLVVTVCDNAAASCPLPPKDTRVLHVPFDDPPQLAKTALNEQEALGHSRRVRDEIEKFILTLPDLLTDV